MPDQTIVIPVAGTPAHAEFMRKARNPDSMEAGILKSMFNQAEKSVQEQLRSHLGLMIELVPGQLFRDVARFHDKFALEPTNNPGHQLPDDLLKFRIKFMLEELLEYVEAVDMHMHQDSHGATEITYRASGSVDMEKAFDALIDLTYVVLGTAFLHRFPFNSGWDRVQKANMEKVRAISADDDRSLRKHAADVVKPVGWVAPVLTDLLGKDLTDKDVSK